MNPSIYISYRRRDTEFAASAIYDRLSAHFGTEAVFIDISSISSGASFADQIKDAISTCQVCLVLIGDNWLEGRLNDPGDWIRNEIEIALSANKPIIPVLVGGATFPASSSLPESLRQLTYFNAVELRTGSDFSGNIERLIVAIERFVASEGEMKQVLEENIVSEPEPAIEASPKPGESDDGRSVFISYRREGGAETARLMRYELLSRGWRVFLDVENLKAGHFDERLLHEVEAARCFLLILSPNALHSCRGKKDWLRREIRQAIKSDRNIVPLLKEGSSRPEYDDLPDDIAELERFNCVEYSHTYYDATLDRLLEFLSHDNKRA